MIYYICGTTTFADLLSWRIIVAQSLVLVSTQGRAVIYYISDNNCFQLTYAILLSLRHIHIAPSPVLLWTTQGRTQIINICSFIYALQLSQRFIYSQASQFLLIWAQIHCLIAQLCFLNLKNIFRAHNLHICIYVNFQSLLLIKAYLFTNLYLCATISPIVSKYAQLCQKSALLCQNKHICAADLTHGFKKST